MYTGHQHTTLVFGKARNCAIGRFKLLNLPIRQSAIDAMDEETATAYIPVMKAARLLSTSAFASLSEEAAPAATPERVEACRDTLFKELSERFDGMPKALVREWMAEVCAELPVWFANRTEVMEYMQQSLRGCRTNGERRYAIAELRKKLG